MANKLKDTLWIVEGSADQMRINDQDQLLKNGVVVGEDLTDGCDGSVVGTDKLDRTKFTLKVQDGIGNRTLVCVDGEPTCGNDGTAVGTWTAEEGGDFEDCKKRPHHPRHRGRRSHGRRDLGSGPAEATR